MTRHFEITEWVDFSRGLGDPCDRTAMQEHLDAGCEPCRMTVAALRQVARVAAADMESAPPSAARRTVEAVFAVRRPDVVGRRQDLSLWRVFDGALKPAVASRSADPDVCRRSSGPTSTQSS